MSEYKFQLTGWQAIVAIVVLIGIFGIRLMTFSDLRDDETLVKKIELQLIADYFPDDVENLKAAYESGETDGFDRLAQSVTSTTLNIESIKASYPLFKFTSSKKVVVKVTYSLDDDSGIRDKGTNYYLFRHGSIGNSWSYKREASVVSYYLNFI
ncbi:MAG: hypothetical protein PVJ44_02500 [Desulfobacterales bacterium]|jgi:hypothetical protein